MTIRVYLTATYLGLVILMALGMWLTAHHLADNLTATGLKNAQAGVQRTVAATSLIAEKVLTTYGEALVDSKVAGVSKGLAMRLRDRDLKDYAALRQDPVLRRLATQKIDTPEGKTGFLMVYDDKGELLFHHLRRIEGRNANDWQTNYKKMHNLLERSYSEDGVKGYYTFFDQRRKKERRRYTSRVRVPGTPFILAAQVNIDEFFTPALEKIQQATEQIIAGARERIQENSRKLKKRILLFTLMGASIVGLLSVLFGFWFAATIARPLENLVGGVQQVGEGDFSVSVPENGVKEVKRLAQSFNLLGSQLTDYIAKRDFIRDTFSRYVTKEVVKKLIESQEAFKLGGETREVSLLISDLRAFTALTATMEPDKVIDLLNRYLGKMIEILLDNEAIIDEIVGDGIIAFFGAPEPMADHPARAVATALQMQVAMEEINRQNRANGLPQLEMGVAVNTGEVVVGNIGSERRAKYSVVGAHVNFASRIESYALGGQVFVSSGTYERIKDLAEVGEVIQVEVKGLPGLAQLYEVRGMKGDYNLHLKSKAETLVSLAQRLPVHLYRFEDKILTGDAQRAWITAVSETMATLVFEGDLRAWDDLSLCLLDDNQEELPGRAYGRVISIQDTGEPLKKAKLHFTALSADALEMIREAMART
jgi:class 3 adenylate cyclase